MYQKYKEYLRKKLGNERAEEKFNRSIQLAGMSEAELNAELEKNMQQIFDKIREKIDKAAGETEDVNGQ